MKKLLFIAGVAAACAAFAADEIVEGTTEVGMIKVDNSTSTDCIVAVPFEELTGGDICVSNIVKTANLAKDDELYVYGGKSAGWSAWVLQTGASGAKYWQSTGKASIDANGFPQIGTSPSADAETLVTGSAIWLRRKNPSGPFYLYGGYKQALSTPVTKGVYNLIANPTDETVNFAGVTTGDQVKVVESATTSKSYRWRSDISKWAYSDKGTWVQVDNLPLLAGQGVWYNPKQSGTINWR